MCPCALSMHLPSGSMVVPAEHSPSPESPATCGCAPWWLVLTAAFMPCIFPEAEAPAPVPTPAQQPAVAPVPVPTPAEQPSVAPAPAPAQSPAVSPAQNSSVSTGELSSSPLPSPARNVTRMVPCSVGVHASVKEFSSAQWSIPGLSHHLAVPEPTLCVFTAHSLSEYSRSISLLAAACSAPGTCTGTIWLLPEPSAARCALSWQHGGHNQCHAGAGLHHHCGQHPGPAW